MWDLGWGQVGWGRSLPYRILWWWNLFLKLLKIAFSKKAHFSFWKRINHMTLIKRPEAKHSSTNNCPHTTSSFPIHSPWQGPAHTKGRWMAFVEWPRGQWIEADEFINVGCKFHHRIPSTDSSLNNPFLFQVQFFLEKSSKAYSSTWPRIQGPVILFHCGFTNDSCKKGLWAQCLTNKTACALLHSYYSGLNIMFPLKRQEFWRCN